MPRNKYDTHFYDGKIKENYKKLVEYDNAVIVPEIPIPDFPTTIAEICSSIDKIQGKYKYKISEKQRVNIFRSIRLIEKNKDKSNYDSKNDIHVNDILPRVWRFIRKNKEDAMNLFIEQVSDIVNRGPCAQGRTTRLYQLYILYVSIPKGWSIENK